MVKLVQHDLEFILAQIRIAEAHAAGTPLTELVDSPLLPYGLRTVDGSYNNIVPGREAWGASGEPFPRLTAPYWLNENTQPGVGDDSIVFGAGSPGQVVFTDGNYGEHGTPTDPLQLTGGTLVDADPRLISNLVVDQTPANPAAIAAALRHAGHTGDLGPMIASIRNPYMLLDAAAQAQTLVDNWAAVMPMLQGRLAAAQMADAANSTPQTQAALAAAQAAVADAQTRLAEAQTSLDLAQAAAVGAQAALDAALAAHGVELDGNTIRIPNIAPDEGLSAPYNSWFTLFGQFFDHGLDLVAKGGNGTVYIPLQPDDPLYNPASPHTNFMAMTRATVGDAAANVTTPWVDQNQTYTSNASHQVFLREYAVGGGRPVATGKLLDGPGGGLATWGDIKAQAKNLLGIELTDMDVGMVPQLATDPYGAFIRGPNGLPMVLAAFKADGTPIYVEGNLAAPVDPSAILLTAGTAYWNGIGTPAGNMSALAVGDEIRVGSVSDTLDPGETIAVSAARIANAFLDDIAHAAAPVSAGGVLQKDDDGEVGYSGAFNSRGQQTAYDDELLDAHYITGDGRGNENIGLTAMHFVFHAEHNRQIEQIKETVLDSGNEEFLREWLLPGADTGDGVQANEWNGERLFQAARFATEMQYQHLVFEEFARKVQPDIDLFMVQPDVELDPAIFAEFANVVYRFGHSMLNETVDRTFADGSKGNIDLFDAFLNPLAFGEAGITQAEMAGAIALGMSAQHANEIDEFVTNVLRNQLVGIPLDLAALNIARGRDTGMPTLNQAREQFMAFANGDTNLKPYESWADFALNIKHPESIVNFIAAYGTHASIVSATTVQAKRDAAMEIVFGTDMDGDGSVPSDRLDFLNARGTYANKRGGLDDVDLWIGGLAEKKMAFGGMLGSTFSFVFQLQMENLQDADRFYYLSRTQGLNLLTELENNSLAKIVMRNTNLSELGIALPADVFSAPDHILYVDASMHALFGTPDPVHDNPVLQAISALVERDANYIRYNGLDHMVIQGTDGNDHILAGGGDDTVWGGDGHDRIEAGYGVDSVSGGAGDDVITSAGTDIGAVTVLKGEGGNDVIVDGTGMSLIFGGDGKDFLVSGADDGEIRGGQDDDFIFGGDGMGMLFGNEGDDWIEGGGGFDYIAGDNGELFFNSTIIGHDVINGGSGDTDYDADSGDDIMIAGEGIQKNIGMWGHDWVIHKGQSTGADADMNFPVFPTLPLEVLRDRFSQVEALSGWVHDDVLRGDDRTLLTDIEAAGPDIYDPTPEGNFVHNELDEAGVARIRNLDRIVTADMLQQAEYWADGSGTVKNVFVGGNILLGGGGSDLFEGRAGDDVIDGDAWLNVRIRFEHEGVAYTTDSMAGQVYRESDYLAANGYADGLGPQFGGSKLQALMLDRTVNPAQLQIEREVLWDDRGEDTAFYWDVRENYSITRNADGSVTVEHLTQSEEFVDANGTASAPFDPITGKARTSDGKDTLYNVEYLQFRDGRVALNSLPPSNIVWNGVVPTNSNLPANSAVIASLSVVDADSTAWSYTLLSGAGFAMSAAGVVTRTGGAMANGTTYALQVRATDESGNYRDETFTILTGNDNGNTLTVSVGNDAVVYGRDGGDTLNGGIGDDTLFGQGGADMLNGGAGNDVLVGGAGNDTINGGSGDDTIIYNIGDGNDTISGGAGIDTLAILQSGNGGATLTASFDGARITQIQNAGTINADVERVTADLGGGTDTLAYTAGSAGVTVDLAAGTASGFASIAGIENVTGTGNADTITGNAGSNTLNGGGGNDTLTGGAGNDTLNGGAGDDTYVFGLADGTDTIGGEGANNGQDRIVIKTDGAALTSLNASDSNNGTNNGNLVIQFDGQQITVSGHYEGTNAQTGVEFINFDGGSHAGYGFGTGDYAISKTDPGGGARTVAVASGDNFIAGESGTDVMNGGTGRDLLFGAAGNDTINGGAGDDLLVGGTGNDTINGGAGDDTIVWNTNNAGGNNNNSDGRDIVNGGEGSDTFVLNGNSGAETFSIFTRAAWQAAGNNLSQLHADTEIVITRNGTNNNAVVAELDNVEEIIINGGVFAGAGAVLGGDTVNVAGDFTQTSLALSTITINGGAGDDTIDFSALTSAHRIVFKSNGGNDTIVGNVRPQDVIELAPGEDLSSYELVGNGNGTSTLTNGTHSITFTGTVPPQFRNGPLDDDDHHVDDADDDDTAVVPPAGNGTFVGTPGNDTLIGTSGSDVLLGGDGADILRGGTADDFLSGEGGADVIFGGDGDDDIFGGAGRDMLYGDAGNDRIFGDDGNDMIFAGAGDDRAFGGAGDDVFVAEKGDGDDVYYGEDGRDTLDMSAITANVTADLGTGFMGRGSVASAQTGNDTIWGIENIVTGSGNDTITASAAVNVIDGGAGNDTFRFLSAVDADGDTILGFQPGDRLDVSGMDADACASGKQSFTLVAGEAFTGRGQLMVTQETREDGDYTVVLGNTTGGTDADFRISIKGSHQLTASDFNL